jgi:hypothetical protein
MVGYVGRSSELYTGGNMKLIHFFLPEDEELLERLINEDDLVIRSKVYVPIPSVIQEKAPEGAPYNIAICFVEYETKKLLENEELEHLDKLIRKAKALKGNLAYSELKNAKQREIFLLKNYQLTAHDAATVMELLKDELKPIIEAS